MRNLMAIVLMASFSHLAQAATPASSLPRAYSFDQFQIGQGSSFRTPRLLTDATIELNYNLPQMALTAYYNESESHKIKPVTMSAPIVQSYVGPCGMIVVIAEKDLRARGGNYTRIELYDHTVDTCVAKQIHPVNVAIIEAAPGSGYAIQSNINGYRMWR